MSDEAWGIWDFFNASTELDIHAARTAMKTDNEKDLLMGQGYILGVERCRNLLRQILKELEVK